MSPKKEKLNLENTQKTNFSDYSIEEFENIKNELSILRNKVEKIEETSFLVSPSKLHRSNLSIESSKPKIKNLHSQSLKSPNRRK